MKVWVNQKLQDCYNNVIGFFLLFMQNNETIFTCKERIIGGNIPRFMKINNFPNEVERMKYFTTRFNVYSPDEIFEYINLYPEDAKYFGEDPFHKKINQGN